jgi:2-phosphosulfolactate phosphatase
VDVVRGERLEVRLDAGAAAGVAAGDGQRDRTCDWCRLTHIGMTEWYHLVVVGSGGTPSPRDVPGRTARTRYISVLASDSFLGGRRTHVTTARTVLGGTNRFYERTEALPSTPPAGDYVVVDVCYFSTTVVELLAGGARGVHVPETAGELFEYRATNPTAHVGGEPLDETGRPKPGHDLHNSPSFVQGVDVADRPVALTSNNGGRCVAVLAEHDDVTVYVGSTTNAPALAAHLANRDRPTYLVAAGSRGDRAPEDEAGAALVAHFLRDDVEYEPDVARDAILAARRGEDTDPFRRRDLERHVTAVGYHDVVPRYENAHLVDVATDRERPLAGDEDVVAPTAGDAAQDADDADDRPLDDADDRPLDDADDRPLDDADRARRPLS